VYAITKYGAEMEIWRGTQEGVNAVTVNPGIILGPGFWKGGGSGNLFSQIHNGLNYFPRGSSAYVDVWDVVDIMAKLMESDIKNERYILTSENLPLKTFQDRVAKALNVKSAKKEASPFLLSIAWRMDWLSHKIFGKRRKLSKQLAKSISFSSILPDMTIGLAAYI
jgi:nucleoside-diphosphate-sugar epimerase